MSTPDPELQRGLDPSPHRRQRCAWPRSYACRLRATARSARSWFTVVCWQSRPVDIARLVASPTLPPPFGWSSAVRCVAESNSESASGFWF